MFTVTKQEKYPYLALTILYRQLEKGNEMKNAVLVSYK